MADVVDLNERRKPSDPDLVESLRIMLSNAQNGRMMGLVAVCLSDEGELDAVVHGPTPIEAVGIASWLHADMMDLLRSETTVSE